MKYKNKNKKTPLLKSANPYFPSNLKINKVNKENKNKTEIIKEKDIKEVNLENKNNIKENIKKNEDKLFKTPISISSNNDYTYSNSSNNSNNNNNNKNNSLKSKSENSINEENNQPGILYNQIISEENEEFNSENNESSNKNKKNISRYSDEEKEENINLNTFINENNKDNIKSDFIEFLNIILIDNYIEIRNKIVPYIINNPLNQEKFIDILYEKSIKEKKYRSLYAKLCKDLDKCLVRKKEKIKSPLRIRLIENSKKNFKNLSNNIYDKNYVFGNLSFIIELINVQLVSKKVGVQTINNLIEKYNKYDNLDNDLFDNKIDIKYIYLESIIIVLNQFSTSLMFFQKDRIRNYDLKVFEKEIYDDILFLNKVFKKENNTIPNLLKFKLINVIDKYKRNWKPYFFESVNQINLDLIPKIPIVVNKEIIDKNENFKNKRTKNFKNLRKKNYLHYYSSDSYDKLYNRQFFEDYDDYYYVTYKSHENYYDNYKNNYSYRRYKNNSISNFQNQNFKNNNFQKWK